MNAEKLRSFDVISKAYRDEQVLLHSRPGGYGGKGSRYADTVEWLLRVFGATSVLDYGCGQGSLARVLRERHIECREYDPAIRGKDRLPDFVDLVVCTDVLEHVERDKLANVLNHIGLLARKAIFVVVALDPSGKTLSDGTNAHIIQQSPEWWEAKIDEHHWVRVDLSELPLPASMKIPEKRRKRWIAAYRPPC